MSDYLPCTDCTRPMRPYNSKAADHPGTIGRGGASEAGQPICSGCAKTARAAAAAARYDQQRPAARPTTAENRANLRSWLVSMGWAGTSV